MVLLYVEIRKVKIGILLRVILLLVLQIKSKLTKGREIPSQALGWAFSFHLSPNTGSTCTPSPPHFHILTGFDFEWYQHGPEIQSFRSFCDFNMS